MKREEYLKMKANAIGFDCTNQDDCLAAVKKNGLNIEYIKDPSEEMCREAVRQHEWALKDVPDSLKTAEMCMSAVKRDGWLLEYVPEHLKTDEICLAAVKQNGLALKYSNQTTDIVNAAVNENKKAIGFIDDKAIVFG